MINSNTIIVMQIEVFKRISQIHYWSDTEGACKNGENKIINRS
jgi:hypothetical protein